MGIKTDQRTRPPSLCSFITLLNHVSVFPFTFTLHSFTFTFTCLLSGLLLAFEFCASASLCLCTIALTPTLHGGVLAYQLSTYVIKSFLLFHSTVAPIIFILVCSKFFHQSFFTPPPWVLSPTFHFPLPFSPS